MKYKKWFMVSLILMLAIAACASAETSGGGDPAETVQRYLRAKVEANEEALRGLLCSEMESVLTREANSFAGVEGAEIEDMQCQRNTGADTVTCTGQIVATYGTELQSFPLRTYRVVEEDGEWKWCGEAS